MNLRTVTAGRDLSTIRAIVKKQEVRSDAWDRAVKRVERYALSSWSFGDLPESIVIEEINGVAVLGYPGLALRDGEDHSCSYGNGCYSSQCCGDREPARGGGARAVWS